MIKHYSVMCKGIEYKANGYQDANQIANKLADEHGQAFIIVNLEKIQ